MELIWHTITDPMPKLRIDGRYIIEDAEELGDRWYSTYFRSKPVLLRTSDKSLLETFDRTAPYIVGYISKVVDTPITEACEPIITWFFEYRGYRRKTHDAWDERIEFESPQAASIEWAELP